MPTCQSCSYKWTWKESFTRFFSVKKEIKCPACNSPQFITKQSRQKWSLLNFIPFFPLLLLSFNVSFAIVIALQILCVIAISLVTPCLYQLSNKDEALW